MYVLVNTAQVIQGFGSEFMLIAGDETHTYPTLDEAAEARNLYALEHNNPGIHVFELIPIDPAVLEAAYLENPSPSEHPLVELKFDEEST